VHGDAAFADFAILLGVSYRIGRKPSDPHAAVATPTMPATPAPVTYLGELGVPLRTLDGRRARLGMKLTVVNLWATWCAPCRAEIPLLNRLAADGEPRGIAFVGVSVDDDPSAVDTFRRDVPIDYASVWGGREASAALHEPSVPTTLFLDASGKVVGKLRGPLTQEAFDAKVRELVPEPAPETAP
jgi:thiol-disulfide isomerase/thioredoxin